MSAAAQWAGYDGVVEAYERFVAANGYAALARDLVTCLGLPPGASVLDVGCGTGVAALAAREAVGAGGLVVGLDVSTAMLRRAAARDLAPLVAGAVPGLPFRDGLFDAVGASLVLSHVEVNEALRDMVRILKRGGRLGLSAGARKESAPNPVYRTWVETAEACVGKEALREVLLQVLPCEEWLSDAAHVATALAGAGLEGIEVRQSEYRVTMAIDDYLGMLDVFLYGRFVRRTLGEAGWGEFRERVAAVARAGCGERVEYTSRYHLGVGRRP